MAEDYLGVTATFRGRVCVLAVSGQLDAATAGELPRRVLTAVDGSVDSLVVDLAGQIAMTEDQIAVTLAWLAEQQPGATGRLAALSRAACQQATDYQRRAADQWQRVA
ncbi:MAG: hypothetical protein JO037_11200 [Actinobacteria bacterium]|nr:hypothetical protein [Actinomycetota bacterium]